VDEFVHVITLNVLWNNAELSCMVMR
jgi:hypothetical protein